MRHTNFDTTHDEGFSLIELLLVVLIVGILATVVVVSVSGITGGAEDTACLADQRMLEKATEVYFAERRTGTIPDAGGDEGFEQTLVDEGFLRQTSSFFNLSTDGQIIGPVEPCV